MTKLQWQSYVVKYSSTVGNLTGDNFDKDEFNTEITNDDLVNSTLEPEVGGTTKTFFIKDSLFPVGEKYVLALRAVDEKGNEGAVSNPVQIYLPPDSTQSSSSRLHVGLSFSLMVSLFFSIVVWFL